MKYITIIILMLLSVVFVHAQKMTIKVDVAEEVLQGERFKVIYTLLEAEASGVDFPAQIKGLDVLHGPAATVSYAIGESGGYEESYKYVYTLQANAVGTFTIPPVTFMVQGRKYKSDAAKIKVIDEELLRKRKLKELEKADIFVKSIVNESEIDGNKVFEVTYRLYATVNISGVADAEYPDFKDFDILRSWTLGRSMYLGEYEGRKYNIVDLKKYILLPRKSGETTVSGGKVEVVFSTKTGRVKNSFFGPVPETVDVSKSFDLESFTIDAGLVGDWSAA
ncbi:BatD family protein [Dysgonomonas sp. OttesenSCG-928-M03]|nr:BatD family protein [Dysgonomonas sp. OttesenSCG-928-M03]